MTLLRGFRFWFCLVGLSIMSQLSFGEPPLPEADGVIHLGVASCASSVCHGRAQQSDSTNVMQNEYTIWTNHDRHAKAYNTLLTKESKLIAAKLGIEAAHKSDLCLDCHTDNVEPGLRGRRFQISDGVGCEGCHGGAEHWIKSHTEPNATHEDNVKAGLYPAGDPVHRSSLCLSCHVGTKNKLATHQIMGAGHPRLSFELDTFSVLQPKHYLLDEDYLQRKGNYDSITVWIYGQVYAAKHWLELIEDRLENSESVFPEMSFYDCHACHHAMDDFRGQSGLFTDAGAMRINTSYLWLVAPILKAMSPEDESPFLSNVAQLIDAGYKDLDKVSPVADQLHKPLDRLKGKLKGDLDKTLKKDLFDSILNAASKEGHGDYATCEQVAMGLSILADDLSLNRKLGRQIDGLYDALGNENGFDFTKFKKALNRLGDKWKDTKA